MRILGEQAAGGDMAKLDKMFESGELITAKYLPMVLAQMKRESDKMMGEYWSSLPYLVNNAARQQELFMRKFAESGAESGLNRFWVVWGQIVEDSIGGAERLGRAFEAAAWKFSNALLIPQELFRWIDGETDERNVWQKMFGDAESNTMLQSVLRTVGDLKQAFDNANTAAMTFVESLDMSTNDTFDMWLRGLIESFGVLVKLASQYSSGDFSGMSKTMSEWQDRSGELVRERDASRGARQSMIDQYGPDRSFWPGGEYTKRFNEHLTTSTLPDTLKPLSTIAEEDVKRKMINNPVLGLISAISGDSGEIIPKDRFTIEGAVVKWFSDKFGYRSVMEEPKPREVEPPTGRSETPRMREPTPYFLGGPQIPPNDLSINQPPSVITTTTTNNIKIEVNATGTSQENADLIASEVDKKIDVKFQRELNGASLNTGSVPQ